MSKQAPDSPVLQYLRLIYEHANEGKTHSWRILNSAMHRSLDTLISSHVKFARDDFQQIAKQFRFGYWAGNDGHMCGEGFYQEAVSCGNTSACISFEQWAERKAFTLGTRRLAIRAIGNGKCLTPVHEGHGVFFFWEKFPKFPATVNPRRWIQSGHEAVPVKITSFSADGKSLVACSYDEAGQILRRFNITPEQLKAQEKQLKKFIEEFDARQKEPQLAAAA